jgi:hypothetical protein
VRDAQGASHGRAPGEIVFPRSDQPVVITFV